MTLLSRGGLQIKASDIDNQIWFFVSVPGREGHAMVGDLGRAQMQDLSGICPMGRRFS